eukprot:TRINITY_DN10174_c0_g1_i2.p1 TRINITY_DN10174_c0_g1~~TRINITY_DN10174_c0_g1_i2.p1  ORF type:complete len:819 (-),score=127.54 TRINITY_DN10174_c0_g1_i2:52-2508(-)
MVKDEFNFSNLDTLNVSGNPLGQTLDARDFLVSVLYLPKLKNLFASGCKLGGDIPSFWYVTPRDRSQSTLFEFGCVRALPQKLGFATLLQLDLSGNSITAIEATMPRSLIKADLSSNHLGGHVAADGSSTGVDQALDRSWWNERRENMLSELSVLNNPALKVTVEPPAVDDCRELEAAHALTADASSFTRSSEADHFECTKLCDAPGLSYRVDIGSLDFSHLCRCLPGFAGSSRSCEPCDKDTYYIQSDHFKMKSTCQQCPANSSTEGSMQQESICSCKCAAGHYMAGASQCQADVAKGHMNLTEFKCLPCEPGRYAFQSGSTACSSLNCPAGKEVDLLQGACQACSPGFHKTSEDDARCTLCKAGHEPSRDSSECWPCPDGYYAQPGEHCQRCPDGQVTDDQQQACRWCPPLMVPVGTTCQWWPVVLSALILTLVACALFIQYLRYKRRRRLAIFASFKEQLHVLKEQALEGDEQSKRDLWQKRGDLTPECAAELERAQADVKEASELLGVACNWILQEFENESNKRMSKSEWRKITVNDQEFIVTLDGCIQICKEGDRLEPPLAWRGAQQVGVPADPNFLQMGPAVASGEAGFGYEHVCPRDGCVGASICDAIRSQGESARANRFLSWVWQYKRSVMISAIDRWKNQHGSKGQGINFWWCFGSNNQYRILQEQGDTSTEVLADIFSGKLRSVGRMLMCMDKFENSLYTSRMWCIFEIYVSSREDIAREVVLPPDFDDSEQAESITTIKELVGACKVHSENATASNENDLNGIKKLIRETSSFEAVDQAVEEALWTSLIRTLNARLSEQDHPSTTML